MNQQWLTTLMSNVKNQLKGHLQASFMARGLRLSSADIMALLEDLSPKASHVALSYAIDLLRPFSAGMGFRVTRLSDLQIELLIPARTRNKNENGEIHEAALLAGGFEAIHLLWERHAPMGDFKIRILKTQMEIFKHFEQDIRVRLELSESLREVVLAELRRNRLAQTEMQAQAYDINDQVVAEIHFHLEFSHIPSLGTSDIAAKAQ